MEGVGEVGAVGVGTGRGIGLEDSGESRGRVGRDWKLRGRVKGCGGGEAQALRGLLAIYQITLGFAYQRVQPMECLA